MHRETSMHPNHMDITDQGFLRVTLIKKLKQHPRNTIKLKEIKQYIQGILELPVNLHGSNIGPIGQGYDLPTGNVPPMSSRIGQNPSELS